MKHYYILVLALLATFFAFGCGDKPSPEEVGTPASQEEFESQGTTEAAGGAEPAEAL